MINNIVFDIGNVLVDYHPARIVRSTIPDPVQAEVVYEAVFRSQGWKLLDRGLITFEDHYQTLAARFPKWAGEIAWILDHWHEDMPPIPGMADLVAGLKRAGYRTFVLSNTSLRFYTYAPPLPIFRLFDGVTLSAEVHLLKPQPEIYDRFCQDHGLAPGGCLFIDDMPENVRGARNAGWHGHRFRDVETLQAQLEGLLDVVF